MLIFEDIYPIFSQKQANLVDIQKILIFRIPIHLQLDFMDFEDNFAPNGQNYHDF